MINLGGNAEVSLSSLNGMKGFLVICYFLSYEYLRLSYYTLLSCMINLGGNTEACLSSLGGERLFYLDTIFKGGSRNA